MLMTKIDVSLEVENQSKAGIRTEVNEASRRNNN